MDFEDAISYLIDEKNAIANTTLRATIEVSIEVLNDESVALTKEQALNNLNDLYWDYEYFIDQNEYGQALFCVSWTTDPNKPYPRDKI